MKYKVINQSKGAIVEEALIFTCIILFACVSLTSLGQGLSGRMYAAGGSISTASNDTTDGVDDSGHK